MMLTTARKVTRVRHALKLRPVTVSRIDRLTPSIVRITFGGESLADFTSASFDDHVKLILPPSPGASLELPTLGPNGPSMEPGTVRPVMRDYTPRACDGRTLTIEMALHGDGPAAKWAAEVALGDAAAVGGPRGSMIVPLDFDIHWLIGDETALPAIARRLEELPRTARAVAIIEVADAADQRELVTAAEAKISWIVRSPDRPHELIDAVAALPAPSGDAFAWAAGEHHKTSAIRRCLVEHHRLDREQVRASAYWKRGADDHHARFDE